MRVRWPEDAVVERVVAEAVADAEVFRLEGVLKVDADAGLLAVASVLRPVAVDLHLVDVDYLVEVASQEAQPNLLWHVDLQPGSLRKQSTCS